MNIEPWIEGIRAGASLPKPKPFLKWVGGKRQLMPEIMKLVPENFVRYYEPFLGGGALYFELQHQGRLEYGAWLSDANLELIRTYKTVRDHPDNLIHLLSRYVYEKNFFLAVRALPPATLTDVEAAARMIYLNKTCFNGLYRVNKSGQFNTPFGKYDNPLICDSENLLACSRALALTFIDKADYLSGATMPMKNDFVYFDPPYVPVSDSSNFTSYSQDGFTDDDQMRLRSHALRLKKFGAHVLLSNSDTPRVRELYKGSDWEIIPVKARRSVNSKAGSRGVVGELLIR